VWASFEGSVLLVICASEYTRPEVLSWVRALLFSQSAGPVICVSIFTGCFKREPVRMVDVSGMNGKKRNHSRAKYYMDTLTYISGKLVNIFCHRRTEQIVKQLLRI